MGFDNPIHIAFLLILLLLVFGAKRLPEMGRSLGSGMRGFKESLSGENVQAVAAPQQHLAATATPLSAPSSPAGVAPAGAPAAAGEESGEPFAA